MKGISICILTYNAVFYNKLSVMKIREFTNLVDYEILVYDNGSDDGSVEWLEAQPDVTLFKGCNNLFNHGQGLDYLVARANYPICACLCSDAFPVSPEWITPAMHLNDEVYLAGIHRGARGKLCEYVCPSYLFGWTDWIKQYTFVDDWPNSDTGQELSYKCSQQGRKIKTWKSTIVEFDDYDSKPCDYNGWAWHTWMTGRSQTVKNVVGMECAKGYHAYIEDMLRERFQLDF